MIVCECVHLHLIWLVVILVVLFSVLMMRNCAVRCSIKAASARNQALVRVQQNDVSIGAGVTCPIDVSRCRVLDAS